MKKNIFYLTVMLIIGSLFIFIIYERISYYPLNSTQDYIYDFNQTNAKIYNIKINSNSLDLSHIDIPENSTIFLQTKVNSDFIGKVITPSIMINDLASYFEPNSKGIRYVNLTSLKNKSLLKIKTNYLKLSNKAKLIVIKNPTLKDKKILIIAPHPDDAEIASFGLYSTYPKNSFILTISAGDAGVNNYDEIYNNDTNKSFFEKAKLRVFNSNTVPLIGGISINNTLNLGYFDATLKKMFYNKNEAIESRNTHFFSTKQYRKYNISPLLKDLNTTKNSWNSLVKDLKTILKILKPDIIVTVYPAIDAHPDHQYTSIALFQAIKELNLKNIKLFLYTNHFINSELYPFGKRYSSMTLPPIYKKSLYFNSIYSHTLSKQKQQEKVLALEAMNDLRLDTDWTSVYGSFFWAIKSLVKHKILDRDETYFRRAVRSDEIFFVIDSNKSQLLSTLCNSYRF